MKSIISIHIIIVIIIIIVFQYHSFIAIITFRRRLTRRRGLGHWESCVLRTACQTSACNDCQIVKLAPAMIVKLSNQRLRIVNVFIIVVLFSRHFCTDADVLIFAIIILFHPYAIVRGDICHSRHCQRQCKVFASGVNF